jgi:hypothetical protein
MLKSTSFSVFVLAFVAFLAEQGEAKPKPGLLDFLKGDECEEIEDNSCAIVYDDEDCGEGNFFNEIIRIHNFGIGF